MRNGLAAVMHLAVVGEQVAARVALQLGGGRGEPVVVDRHLHRVLLTHKRAVAQGGRRTLIGGGGAALQLSTHLAQGGRRTPT